MDPSGDLEARVRALEDIEAIKNLKARYWRCIDLKLWEAMAGVFTEDAAADYGPDRKLKGRQAIVGFLKSSLGADSVFSHHIGQRPEIELTGEATARGAWWLCDYIVMPPNVRRRGYAYYEDEYLKQDRRWRVSSTRLVTLLEERDTLKR